VVSLRVVSSVIVDHTSMSPSIQNSERDHIMRPKEDTSKAEVSDLEKEKDFFSQFEQNQDFRRFVRKLSRCRSIASLDVNNVIGGGDNANEDIIEDEKGKKGSVDNKSDDIKIKDYKMNTKQSNRHKNNVIETWANGDFYEEKSGRGENKTKTSKTRPYSDCYGENRTVNNGNSDLSFNFERSSTSPVSYNTMTLPRREKRASVILREKHQSMMMIQEGEEASRSGTFSLPRVSCFHRSTRL